MVVVAAGGRPGAVARRVATVDVAVWGLVGLGLVLRVVQYAQDRSLRVDESFLALNLMRRSVAGLARTLDFNQGAPYGFLVASKAVTAVLGDGELALRLLPLLAGLAALLLFPLVARAYADGAAVVLAVALFALADGVVFYTSDFKPYSLDVLGAVLVLLGAHRFLARPPGTREALALGLGATTLLWFSYAGVFAVAGAVIVLAAAAAGGEGYRPARRPLAVAALPAALSLAAVLVYSLSSTRSLRGSFGDGNEGTLAGMDNLVELGGAAASNLGLTREEPWSLLTKLAFVLALVGLVAALRRDTLRALVLVLPVPLVIVASLAGLYPTFARTILFLVPPAAVLIAQGIAAVANAAARAGPAALALLAAAVLAAPVAQAVEGLGGRDDEAVRSVLGDVRARWRGGEGLYLHYGAAHPFAYYVACGCFSLEGPTGTLPWRGAPAGTRAQWATPLVPSNPRIQLGRYHEPVLPEYRDELARLRGRVWVVVGSSRGEAETAFLEGPFLRALDERGTRLETFRTGFARAYLYDFSASGTRRQTAPAATATYASPTASVAT